MIIELEEYVLVHISKIAIELSINPVLVSEKEIINT